MYIFVYNNIEQKVNNSWYPFFVICCFTKHFNWYKEPLYTSNLIKRKNNKLKHQFLFWENHQKLQEWLLQDRKGKDLASSVLIRRWRLKSTKIPVWFSLRLKTKREKMSEEMLYILIWDNCIDSYRQICRITFSMMQIGRYSSPF